jgi:hypothetical protein
LRGSQFPRHGVPRCSQRASLAEARVLQQTPRARSDLTRLRHSPPCTTKRRHCEVYPAPI